MAEKVKAHPRLELLAPLTMNIWCFRYVDADLPQVKWDAPNDEVVIQLQLQGIAAPSTTDLNGKAAIRVNITNHRTRFEDLDLLVRDVDRIAGERVADFDAKPHKS